MPLISPLMPVPQPPPSLAPIKSRIATFWYWLTKVHLEEWLKTERERERERERDRQKETEKDRRRKRDGERERVKMSPPTKQHPVLYRPDALPVGDWKGIRPVKNSVKALKGNFTTTFLILLRDTFVGANFLKGQKSRKK